MLTTTLPAFVDPGLESFLIEKKVEISAIPLQSGSLWSTLLFGFGPALLIIAFYVWMYRWAQQGGVGGALMGFGKSKARRYDQESVDKVTFEDVAGIDEAENELVEIVDFLKDPAQVHSTWRHGAEGSAARGCAWHGEDIACEGGRGRSGRAVLFDERRSSSR